MQPFMQQMVVPRLKWISKSVLVAMLEEEELRKGISTVSK